MLALPNGKPIDLDMLGAAIEDADLTNEYFLNLITGEVIFFSGYIGLSREKRRSLAKINKSSDYVEVKRNTSHEAYQWMVGFVNECVAPRDKDAAEQLFIALDGKGAFRRFKDALHRVDEQWLRAWYRWKDERLRAMAEEWLKSVLEGGA